MVKEQQEQEQRQELFRDYIGQCLWDIDTAIRRRFFDAKNDLPQYIELAHPERKVDDKRSAAEITQHILDRLTEG